MFGVIRKEILLIIFKCGHRKFAAVALYFNRQSLWDLTENPTHWVKKVLFKIHVTKKEK